MYNPGTHQQSILERGKNIYILRVVRNLSERWTILSTQEPMEEMSNPKLSRKG
jgi:hypothetical protein